MKIPSVFIIAAALCGLMSISRAQDMDAGAPVVIKTVPEAGSKDVPPGEYEVKVTFSKEMQDRSWSWTTAWENSTPEMIGQPHYDTDHKTCVLKVKLEPGKAYGWWLNSEKFTNFKDMQGHPAVPYLLTFQCAERAGVAAGTGLHINPATGMQEGGPDDMSSGNVMTMGYKADGEVKELIASGQYDDALQRCLAFHDKYKSANGSLIPLLGDWVELGRRYPKAKEALIDIRDKDVHEFAEGRGYFDLFSEVNSINGYLHQEDSTYALYKSLGSKDPELEGQCYLYVEGLLVARGEYQTYYDHMNGDAQGKFDSIHEMYTRQQENLKRMAEQSQRTAKMIADLNKKNGIKNGWTPTDASAGLKKSAENSFVGSVRQLVEVLVGTGHKEVAVKICNEAIAVLDDERLHSAVVEAELKVKRHNEAQANDDFTPASRQPRPLDGAITGRLKLIAGGPLNNVAVVRAESIRGFPAHEIVAHFAGPPLPAEALSAGLHALFGPTLVPSPLEKMNGEWQPVPANSVSISAPGSNTNNSSSCWYSGPNECQLEFALADAQEAAEASRQIRAALAQPLDMKLGQHYPLFKVGEREAWLELRELKPATGKLSYYTTFINGSETMVAGHSPVTSPTNDVTYYPQFDCALVAIPAGSTLTVQAFSNGTNEEKNLFSTTLTNDSARFGRYWLTWHPGDSTNAAEAGWDIYIHDAQTAEELKHFVSRQPMPHRWRSDWADYPALATPNEALEKVILINDGMAQPGNMGVPSAILGLRLTMAPLNPAVAGIFQTK